ncbi:MAG: asparagine synthase (glutamine-hydrolyzing) [Candidatus Andersenbacteria bacterium RIFCSPHIGHO2_12_FULL_45_11b]|uniref:asparagine synthase (glutamine-hydrolyzing) n=1 Tax=Candidatus Andersenbacteria bacterium RIFCSPHIGHO2_12_FULL_45_11b TaxID=1797282 RepID=A0A1G1XCI3_9BACT|nr:MAG: asparagine synthase (glutamine-hydrolyzing) [Candidatus Andersenbacteria bacterium RIFCSPHIGHO2_12_FULL_45_11b]
MCGITGKLSFRGADVAASDIERMNSAIAHRGPDGTGIYLSPDHKVGLGHQRLSIVDLSPLGAQPMRYVDRYEIVFNGEIYNFQEEKKLLKKMGYRFNSHTDTEVILALYDAYKEDCVQHLRGMFAFAIYDEQEDVLFCARDRVGQKPLKYFYSDSVFIFASELKAILTQSEYPKAIDHDTVTQMLVLQYVPGDCTGFSGIKKLLPGHSIIINRKTGSYSIKRYWDISYGDTLNYSENTWKEKVLGKLRSAVHEQMMGDVPVGAMLSGGLDSSLIVALMAEHTTSPIQTFSVGFTGQQTSELPFANRIAQQFRTSHHQIYISPASVETLPELVRIMEEPFADHGALPTLLMSRKIAEHVKVALNGDGGDENFAGYDRYTTYRMSEILQVFAPLLAPGKDMLPQSSMFDKARRFISSLSLDGARRYLEYVSYISSRDISYPENDSIQKSWDSYPGGDTLSRLLSVDFHTYLPGALLPKVDMTAMAASLEGRSPFLDHEFLELTAAMPSNLKMRGLHNRKYLLKEIAQNYLPHEIIYRKKQGFSVPLNAWFQDDLYNYAQSLLLASSARINLFLSKEYTTATLQGHKTVPTKGRQVWAMLMVELWLREYFP